ncbi:MAG: PQQ-binding-like beta-propeller repeat protein [Thermomicrobiales bacterium]|nr:PQQ-binding-like beta-propeller repeat protein [Thermomicrobiales bacterium]
MPVLLTILLVLGLVATPVATPVLPAIQPDTTVVLSSSAIVRPLIADGVIYIATESRDILAIDSDTGATLWTTPLQTAASDELMMVGTSLLIPGDDGTLYRLDASTGSLEGGVVLGSEALQTPVIMETVIAVPAVDGTLHVLDSVTLEQVNAMVVGSNLTNRRAQVGESLILPVGGNTLIAVSIPDLSIQWTYVLPSDVTVLYPLGDEALIVGDGQGLVSGLDADGTLLWQQIMSAYAVEDIALGQGVLLVSLGGGTMAFLDPENGQNIGNAVFPGRVRFAEQVCTELCNASVSDGSLTAIDPVTGRTQMRAVLPATPSAPPAQHDGVLAVPVANGSLLIWKLAGN